MQLLTNNAATTLNGAINNVVTTVIVANGSLFPNPTGGDFFLLTIIGLDVNGVENAWEIVKVTARATNSLTVVRGWEGTTAAAWPHAATVQLRMTAATDHITSATHAATNKTTIVDSDEIAGLDSAGAFGLVRHTWTNVKAFLKTYFDTLYTPAAHAGSTGTAHGNAVAAGAAGFMTGADKSKLDAISGTNTGDETGVRVAVLNHAAAVKSALVDADEITGQDSAASFGLIRITWTSVKAFLKTYFDTLYAPVGGGGLTGFRNRIINGDMRIDQRNAGVAITRTAVSGIGDYPVDRSIFSAAISGTVSTVVQRVADAPAGFAYSAKVTCTTANSGWSAADTFQFKQKIEGLNVIDIGWLDGTARYYVSTYTINSANTWEYKTVTVAAPVSGATIVVSFWIKSSLTGVFAISMNLSGTASSGYVSVTFDLGQGATYQTSSTNVWGTTPYLGTATSVRLMATSGATWQVTGLQFEPGTTETTFEQRPYSVELALCQRYLPVLYATTLTGLNITTTVAYIAATFPVEARVAPTGVSNTVTGFLYNRAGGNFAVTTCVFSAAGRSGAFIQLTAATATLTVGDGGFSYGGTYQFTGCEIT